MTEAGRIKQIYNSNIQQVKDDAESKMLLALPAIISEIEDKARKGHKQMKYTTTESIHFAVALQEKLKKEGFNINRQGATQPDKTFGISW